MQIAYIGDHSGRYNDDEGAITYALESLGHKVCQIPEDGNYQRAEKCELVLFHHQHKHIDRLAKVNAPKVCWYFDLVYALEVRDERQNVDDLRSICSLFCCTDGGYTPSGIVHLQQGADNRILGNTREPKITPILYIGSTGMCDRLQQLSDLERKYGNDLLSITGRTGVFRKDLRKITSRTKIVISLQHPANDRYWSNRVYIVCGFGGFMLHPYCEQLANCYRDREEIVFYSTRNEMVDLIDYYLEHDEEREHIATAGFELTKKDHTYKHRCEKLIKTVKSRGIV